ncbi:chemotaxis protein CheW [Paenibacillus hexagrammi]|uniref:Chemotaxis protein CheW n=1 Tax=Paenibacillus hexagrammi TaxID=2908839 RepID=A0ABY3SKQ4_9BACL|nr:chemotaxis protein CheW [Paenibacillus sp. YPD9-1]UJF34428.1 chemotaxis protein CheW [Paenibacillus sp. YPD9-1]
MYPIVELSDCLKETASSNESAEGIDQAYMVILKSGISLKVDALIGQQEVVIKPLDACFRHLNFLSCASILGDGSVLLILNSYAIQAQKQLVAR